MSMPTNTAEQLVNTSVTLMKLHGYHGFSYADVAREVGIRKASIHHHFAAKQDLAAEAIRVYTKQTQIKLEEILREEETPLGRLQAFGAIFLNTFLAEGSMCLCASLTSDWESLPELVQQQVSAYWDHARAWLRTSLWDEHSPLPDRQRTARANAIISLLEGALLCARADAHEQALRDAIQASEVLLKH